MNKVIFELELLTWNSLSSTSVIPSIGLRSWEPEPANDTQLRRESDGVEVICNLDLMYSNACLCIRTAAVILKWWKRVPTGRIDQWSNRCSEQRISANLHISSYSHVAMPMMSSLLYSLYTFVRVGIDTLFWTWYKMENAGSFILGGSNSDRTSYSPPFKLAKVVDDGAPKVHETTSKMVAPFKKSLWQKSWCRLPCTSHDPILTSYT